MIADSDRALFEQIKLVLCEGKSERRKTNYVRKTELLWVGRHYLLTRTGPKLDDGKSIRKVHLWSREWLVLRRGNPESNPMVALALAAIDPIHYAWKGHNRRLLHSTNVHSGHDRFRGRKLTKTVLAEIITFCEEEDRTFPERERQASAEFEARTSFSQITVQLVKNHEFEVQGLATRNGVEYPVGYTYGAQIGWHHPVGRRDRLDFTPNETKTITARIWDTEFEPDEFEILLEALGRIHKNRLAQKPLYVSVPAPQEEEEPE